MATCECTDPGCECNGTCKQQAIGRLYRIDMDDSSGFLFCELCTADARDSGVFDDRPFDTDQEQPCEYSDGYDFENHDWDNDPEWR